VDNILKETKSRIIGLDIIRSVAILIVLYGHAGILLPTTVAKKYYEFLPQLDGVALFFVLSGFLIGLIFLKMIESSSFTITDLLNFGMRRWFRTLPNYFLVLAILIGYRIIIFHNTNGFSWNYVFFFQNFAWRQPGFFRESWSLSVEEWFYLLFPLVCFIFYKCLKNKFSAILYTLLTFLIFPLLLRIIKYSFNIGSQDLGEDYNMIVVLRIDSLMYGIIAACLYRYKRALWIQYKLIALIAGLAVIIFMEIDPKKWLQSYPPLYSNIQSIAILGLMPFFSELKSTKNSMVDNLFVWISKLSYGLYLLNLTLMIRYIIPAVHNLIGWKYKSVELTYKTDYLIFWVGNLVGAYLIYSFYEKPTTNLRDRFKFSSRRKSISHGNDVL